MVFKLLLITSIIYTTHAIGRGFIILLSSVITGRKTISNLRFFILLCFCVIVKCIERSYIYRNPVIKDIEKRTFRNIY